MHIILCSINRNKIFKKILIVDYISRKSWYSYTQQNMHVCVSMYIYQGFPGGSDGKESPAMQETQKTQVQSLGWEDPLEKGMTASSSTLAWRFP